MKTTTFPTNLFDYDFAAEETAKRVKEEQISETESQIIEYRSAVLRRLKRRALDENRIDTYFRLCESLESYASEPIATPSAYGIPEVKLTYVSDIRERPHVMCSEHSAMVLRSSYSDGEIEMQEFFKVLYLNHGHKALGVHTVSKGGQSATIVDPKIVFTGALLAHAAAIIVCHNHPSGTLTPSVQDDNLTRKLREAGKVLEVPVLDHIILTEDGYYSYQDNGRI